MCQNHGERVVLTANQRESNHLASTAPKKWRGCSFHFHSLSLNQALEAPRKTNKEQKVHSSGSCRPPKKDTWAQVALRVTAALAMEKVMPWSSSPGRTQSASHKHAIHSWPHVIYCHLLFRHMEKICAVVIGSNFKTNRGI